MSVEELKNNDEWAEFLQKHPEGTFYHSLKWREVIKKSFSVGDHYIVIKDQYDSIIGICPGFITNSIFAKTYFSLPNSDYGGPIFRNSTLKSASILLRNYLQKLCFDKDVDYTNFCFTDTTLSRYFETANSFTYESGGVVEIDLKSTPSDFIWKNVFSRNRRYQIKRIDRKGLQVTEAKSKSELADFYKLYHKNMLFIGAVPNPFGFIENMWKILHPTNLRILLLLKKEPIGGILVFKFGKKIYWYYAGIDREKSKNLSVIPFLLWKEIKIAEAEGYRYISLGSTPSDQREKYYLNKIHMGGRFQLQRTIWNPFSPRGEVLINLINKIYPTYRNLSADMRTNIKKLVRIKSLSAFF